MPAKPVASENPARRALSRRDVFGWMAALAGVSPSFGSEAGALADMAGSFDSERKRLGVPSLSVALVEEGRLTLHQRGLRDASRGDDVGPDTLYQAASISKTVAAITALALANTSRLSLDTDVAAYLKRWKLPEPAAGSRQPVTLRRLFGMTAGCNVPGYAGYAAGTGLPDDIQILEGVPPANSQGVRIVAPPGTARAYSGGGCQVAQVAMEDAAGTSFPLLVGQYVLSPLAMHGSGFFQPPGREQQADVAFAHDRTGQPIPGRWHVYPEYAAAGLWSTPSELAQIIVAMIAAERGGVATMLTSVDGLGYGLGVALAGEGRRRLAMKRGNNLGFRNGLVACPGTGQGAVVMTNGDGGEPVVDALLDALAARYRWPQRAPWPE